MERLLRSFRPNSLPALAMLSAGAIAMLAILPTRNAAASETRGYVVSLFTNAAYSTKDDCRDGVDPYHVQQLTEELVALGMSRAKAEKTLEVYENGGPEAAAARDMITNRGRVNGKPVNAYVNPAAVIDPKLHWVIGHYAYGFNLDGRGADSPNSFEDPVTHEKGVNNQLFRVFGCANDFRGPPATLSTPSFYTVEWSTLRPSFPAWLITISGADLSKDGPVTIDITRSLDHVLLNAQGNTESNATFRIDPDPRSHNVFAGQIKDGIVTLTDHHDLHLLGDPVLVSRLDLSHTHLRLTLKSDGDADGIIGGYQPWMEIFAPIGHGAINFEQGQAGVDIPGLYWALRNLADADPDPRTGQNQSISTAWAIEAVPAFIVTAQGTALPAPVQMTLANKPQRSSAPGSP
ncbi:MAG TPA: hypothetical protein VMF64_09165 [Steroidobacteraceae bacterium]|nr:hypothetical protein [Steroidobacteraceae bacterium]